MLCIRFPRYMTCLTLKMVQTNRVSFKDSPRKPLGRRPMMWPKKKGAFVLGSRTSNNIRSPLSLTFLFLGFGRDVGVVCWLRESRVCTWTRYSRNLSMYLKSDALCMQTTEERERTLFRNNKSRRLWSNFKPSLSPVSCRPPGRRGGGQ